MQNKLILLLLLIVSNLVTAQIVDIPDANFKNALVNTLCVAPSWTDVGLWTADVNNDGEIQVSEAEAIVHLIVSGQNIESLRGIEAFIGLKSLSCGSNQLTTLDLSQNTSLIYLSCGSNQIANLNITQNSNLIYINCDGNNLQEIDVTHNLNLEELYCVNNNLQSIDLSQNSNLTRLIAENNQLSSIDLTNNINLTSCNVGINNINEIDLSQNINLRGLTINDNNLTEIDVSNNLELRLLVIKSNPIEGDIDLSEHTNDMYVLQCENTLLSSINIKNGKNLLLNRMWAQDNPNLTCIVVDDEVYANSKSCDIPNSTGWCKDETAIYSEDCILGITEQSLQEAIQIYPNPVKNVLQIGTENNVVVKSVQVYDVMGKKLLETTNVNLIDVSSFANGLLFVKIETDRGAVMKKVLKE